MPTRTTRHPACSVALRSGTAWSAMETLEPRRLLASFVFQELAHITGGGSSDHTPLYILRPVGERAPDKTISSSVAGVGGSDPCPWRGTEAELFVCYTHSRGGLLRRLQAQRTRGREVPARRPGAAARRVPAQRRGQDAQARAARSVLGRQGPRDLGRCVSAVPGGNAVRVRLHRVTGRLRPAPGTGRGRDKGSRTG